MPRRVLWLLVAIVVLFVGCEALEVTPSPAENTPLVPATTTPTTETEPTITAPATQSPAESPTATLLTPSPTAEVTELEPTAVMQEVDTPEPTPTLLAESTPVPVAPQIEILAPNLQVPWAMAFAPGGRLFFTERPGRIRLIVDGQLREQAVAELPVAAEGEGGLLGIALDPAFSDNGFLYVMYTYEQGGGLFNRVARLTVEGETATGETTLIEGIPGARNHDGGALAFGPDGKLYVGTGDAGQRDLAQELNSLAGKILRLNSDGSIPEDNPFPDSPIYSYGHRNPQGLAWQPGTGRLFATEHGPSGEMGLCCRDELNAIEAGGNYGWPLVSGIANDDRFIDPILYSGADYTWAPAGLAFYESDLLPGWRGNLFFGALRGEHLHRVVLGGPDGMSVIEHEELFQSEYGRIRAVALGPEGALYMATSNRDGRALAASNDDRILRLVPAP
ncbi:MAG: PQQ-dependent sugar dehydrogenase [Anaerolineae bacterium]